MAGSNIAGCERSVRQELHTIFMVGCNEVGKWALMNRFVGLPMDEPVIMTHEDPRTQERLVDDEIATIDLVRMPFSEWDNPGLSQMFLQAGDGFLLVYAVNSRQSFEALAGFHQRIIQAKNKNYWPVVIVGNKCDLEDVREVTTEGEKQAKLWGCKFFETSAKSPRDIDEALYELVREIRRAKHPLRVSDSPKTARTPLRNKHPGTRCKCDIL